MGLEKCSWIRFFFIRTSVQEEKIKNLNCKRLDGLCAKPRAKSSMFRKRNEHQANPILAHIQFMFFESAKKKKKNQTVCDFREKKKTQFQIRSAFRSGFAAAGSHFSGEKQADRQIEDSCSFLPYLRLPACVCAECSSSAYGGWTYLWGHVLVLAVQQTPFHSMFCLSLALFRSSHGLGVCFDKVLQAKYFMS